MAATCTSTSVGVLETLTGFEPTRLSLCWLGPDVILANGVTSVAALQRQTTSIPIVFVQLC